MAVEGLGALGEGYAALIDPPWWILRGNRGGSLLLVEVLVDPGGGGASLALILGTGCERTVGILRRAG